MMRKEKNGLVLILMLVLFAITIMPGCKPGNADAITENILVSMNNEDYASFSKDFSEDLKAKLPQESFPGYLALTKGVLGAYKENSKQTIQLLWVGEMCMIEYVAVFEQKGAEMVAKMVVVWFVNNQVVALMIDNYTLG
jgi:hypothetical protein